MVLWIGIIQLVTACSLMLLTDKFGRRTLVFSSVIICTLTLLVVGILGLVTQTKALKDFLIFVACVWSFANSVSEFNRVIAPKIDRS
jgi:hypothetical protein